MKHSKFLWAIIALVFLATGCSKQIEEKKAANAISENNSSLKKSTILSDQAKATLAKLRASLPAGYEKRLKSSFSLMQKVDPEYSRMVQKAVGLAEPSPCDDNTPLQQWLNQQLADWDSEVIFWAIVSGMLDFPTYDALLFENSSDNQYFGVNGEYTHQEDKTFKDLKRFWDIQSSGIVLAGMHGSMLQDRERVIRIDMILYGDDRATAEFWADTILLLLQVFPQYRNGDHPIFTFNSFAQPGFDFPPFGRVADKIVMGDGIIDGYRAIGYEDVAPQSVLAHEFGHHIQFQLNVFGGAPSPESTRRTELMADAFSAYYLSHARGAAMQWKRVKQFLQVFFNIGDCAFTSNGHHGTPTQRMASAEWAYHLADDAQKQGHILPSAQFVALFDAELPQIIAQ
jgi:hypothetical protein